MSKMTTLFLVLLAMTQICVAQRVDKILIQGNPAGTQTAQSDPNGSVRAEYSYNDRGRGDHIIANWKVNAAGVPIAYESHGNDYMKAPVEEHFELRDGKAKWKNRGEEGEQAVTGEAFYFPMNAPPEFLGVLARALLKAPGHSLSLLPAGEARIEQAEGGSKKEETVGELTEYRISGLAFSPQAIWLDHNGNTVASISSWFSVVSPAAEKILQELKEAQDKNDNAWSQRMARNLAYRPRRELLIRNARLFYPRDLTLTPGVS